MLSLNEHSRMIDTEMDILFYFVVLQDRDSKAYGRIFLFPLAGLLIDSKHALSGAGAKMAYMDG
jgi:hypothetical protein